MQSLIEKRVYCPYCAEPINVLIEAIDEDQQYIEDCQVCWKPIVFSLSLQMDGSLEVSLNTENDSF